MTHALSLPLADADDATSVQPLFDALITPPSSLGDRGFSTFLAATLAVVCLIDLAFIASGFWWATLFLTGNLVFLLAAFVAVRRGRNRAERIVVADGEVYLQRLWQGRAGSADSLPLFGLRLVRVRDAGGLCRRLELHSRGRRLAFAGDLTPDEREEFAAAFGRCLHRAGHNLPMPVQAY